MIIGLAAPLFMPTVTGMLIMSAINGFGFGLYMACDTALMTEVLPGDGVGRRQGPRHPERRHQHPAGAQPGDRRRPHRLARRLPRALRLRHDRRRARGPRAHPDQERSIGARAHDRHQHRNPTSRSTPQPGVVRGIAATRRIGRLPRHPVRRAARRRPALRGAGPAPRPGTACSTRTQYGATPQREALAEITLIPEPSIPGTSTLNVNVFTPAPATDGCGAPRARLDPRRRLRRRFAGEPLVRRSGASTATAS